MWTRGSLPHGRLVLGRVTQESCTLADLRRAGKQRSKKQKKKGRGGIFLYLTSEYKQCEISADLPVPLGLFSIQNTEGHVVQEICINVVGGGQLLFSETPCPYHIFIIAGASPLMVNILALHYNAQLGMLFFFLFSTKSFQSSCPRSGSPAKPSLRSKTGKELEKSE